MGSEVWARADVLCVDCGHQFKGWAWYFQRQRSASGEPGGWMPADKPAVRCENPDCRSYNTIATEPRAYDAPPRE